MFVCGVKPSGKVTCVNTEEIVMEGQMPQQVMNMVSCGLLQNNLFITDKAGLFFYPGFCNALLIFFFRPLVSLYFCSFGYTFLLTS